MPSSFRSASPAQGFVIPEALLLAGSTCNFYIHIFIRHQPWKPSKYSETIENFFKNCFSNRKEEAPTGTGIYIISSDQAGYESAKLVVQKKLRIWQFLVSEILFINRGCVCVSVSGKVQVKFFPRTGNHKKSGASIRFFFFFWGWGVEIRSVHLIFKIILNIEKRYKFKLRIYWLPVFLQKL